MEMTGKSQSNSRGAWALPKEGPLWLDNAIFWIIPALAAIVIFRQPFGLGDLGWQVTVGDLIVRHGSPFIPEQFAARHLGEPSMPNAWAAQVIYAKVHDLFGFRGLRAFDTILWACGPAIAVIPARLKPEARLAILFALVVGYMLAIPAGNARPQNFASLGFGITMVLLQRIPSWRVALFAGLPFFVVWQNLHPSVPVAALVLGMVTAVHWFQNFRGKGERPIALTVLTMVAGVSVFATPAGISIIQFAGQNTIASKALGASEWFPLWHPVNRQFLPVFIASVVAVCIVGVKERKGIPLELLIPLLATMVLTLFTARFLLFYAIATVPFLARLRLNFSLPQKTDMRTIATGFAVSAILIILLSTAMPFKPRTEKADEVFGALAMEAKKNGITGGTVFNEPSLGGAITYFGFPHWQVAFDGRFYLYGPAEIHLLKRTASDGSVLADIERLYHPNAYALDPSRSAALVKALAARPDIWRRVYDNGYAVLYIRHLPQPAK